MDFLPNLNDETYLAPMRRMRIVLLTGEHDIALQSTRFISQTLTPKGVENELAIWWGYTHHCWLPRVGGYQDLILTQDDYSRRIVGWRLEAQETLWAHLCLVRETIAQWGRPLV